MSKSAVTLPCCPYFSKERMEVSKLLCEGASIRFPGTVSRRKFLSEFCASLQGYKSCPICRMMDDYYANHDEPPVPCPEERQEERAERIAENAAKTAAERTKRGAR